MKVLERKGLEKTVIDCYNWIYNHGITIPVINNIPCDKISNIRKIRRQGDCLSSIWFGYGIDLLLEYLNNRLEGIIIHATPVLGPALKGHPRRLPPIETRYKALGYCDDIKPAVTK